MKDEIKQKRGKKSRAQGGVFEKRVMADLEEKGWIVDKWTNNVELPNLKGCGSITNAGSLFETESYCDSFDGLCDKCKGKLVQAKPKFLFINGSMKMVGNSSGFPDFIAMRVAYDLIGVNGINPKTNEKYYTQENRLKIRKVIGVESKMTGELDREEKEKCRWLLDNGIFDEIMIAEKTKVKNKVVIIYHDFKKKYWRFYDSKD